MNFYFILGLIVSYGLVLGIGLWASKNKESGNSVQNMFLAGRNLPVFLGFFTMTATWVGGGYINGAAEAVYQNGLRWTQAPWGYSLSLLIGGLFFAIPMRKANYNTFLDPFHQKYGEKTAAFLFIVALIGELFWSSAILAALGATFSTLFYFDYQWSIIISSSLAISYTLLGGLWSVAYTDLVQLLFIILGLCIAIPFAGDHISSWSGLYLQYRVKFGHLADIFPSMDSLTSARGFFSEQIGVWIDGALLLALGGIPWGVYFQRVLASSSPKQARSLSLAASVGCLLLAIPPVLIGMIATGVDWKSVGLDKAPEASLVLPYVLRYLTPNWVAAVGLGAVGAAVMSSVDSSILSVAGMFTLNVYRPLVNPDVSENQMQKIIKLTIFIVGVMATWLALIVKSVYALWYLCSDLVYVLLFPQLVLVLFFNKIHPRAVIGGVLTGVALRLGMGEPILGIKALLPQLLEQLTGMELYISLWPYRTMAMLSSFIMTVLLSFIINKMRYWKSQSTSQFRPILE